ncbi:hypothetical protein CKAN_00788500 [Cinnamomum micranthum f. kanehirae]|uniref:RING-type E3 ubiquitin transferase n=1 Tax=Cinnamomum micranthum f. kanehirae TaxID=337451 RepID=A0A3S3N207_9MAGN|nr:hypothetical protein CKAN_00788500 [Cinnamomum micranthum f. kanehirae]
MLLFLLLLPLHLDPPPPPPPPPFHFSQDNSNIIITISLLGSAFMVISLCTIVARLSSNRNSTIHEDHVRGDVRRMGLEESVIESITVCKYKRGGGLFEGTECSICLNEFREDENLRLLPNCIHAFHLPCIDTWLKSNVNCPLCRMNVISNPMSSQCEGPSSSSSTTTTTTTSTSTSTTTTTTSHSREESHNDIGLEINRSNGVGGNHRDTHVDVSALDDSSSTHMNCGFRSQSNLGAVEMTKDDIQLVRITVSMDLTADTRISKEEAPQRTELVQSEETRSQASLDSDDNEQNNRV